MNSFGNFIHSHRLVDYLVVCGVGDVLEPMDPSTEMHSVTDLTSVPLKPSLLDRYPLSGARRFFVFSCAKYIPIFFLCAKKKSPTAGKFSLFVGFSFCVWLYDYSCCI
jgi:hypothetical protein